MDSSNAPKLFKLSFKQIEIKDHRPHLRNRTDANTAKDGIKYLNKADINVIEDDIGARPH